MTDMQLDTLEARGLIRIASFEPELEYLFRHALLQDTAYESLLKQERRALHDVVGQTLEELYPDRLGELAAILAMHYESAGDTDKAIHYLAAAASFAFERNALVEADDLYRRAQVLLPEQAADEQPELLRRRAEIAYGRARAAMSFTPDEEIAAIVASGLRAARALGDLRLELQLHLTIAVLRQLRGESVDTNPDLRSTLDRITQIGAELDDPFVAAVPESLIGLSYVARGYLRQGVDLLARTAPLLEQKHDYTGSSFALMFLSMGYARLGDFANADACIERAAAVAEKGDLIARLDTMIGRATINAIEGKLDEAVPLVSQCTEMAEETGAVACVVASSHTLGDALMRQGKFLDAERVLRRGNDVASALNETNFRPTISAYLRTNEVYLGKDLADDKVFEDGIEQSRLNGDRWGEANIYWKRAEAEAVGSGEQRNVERMLSDYATADEMFTSMEAKPFVARLARDWGVALHSAGRKEDGDQKLRHAIELFDELGIAPEATEARQALTS
jgi:tetratricopeptide (TPR) repeat protein